MQGFEEGHTLPCFPIQGPGVSLHGPPSFKDTDVDRREVRKLLCAFKYSSWGGTKMPSSSAQPVLRLSNILVISSPCPLTSDRPYDYLS